MRAAVPSAVDATFVISVNLAAPLNMRRVEPGALRSLLLLLTPLLVRPGPVRALRAGAVQHTISPRHDNVSRGGGWGGVAGLSPLFFFFFLFFLEEPLSGSVTLLRPSPGKCADIAVRHRFRATATWLRQQSAQAAGSSGWCSWWWWWWWDLLRNTSWQCGHRVGSQSLAEIPNVCLSRLFHQSHLVASQ